LARPDTILQLASIVACLGFQSTITFKIKQYSLASAQELAHRGAVFQLEIGHAVAYQWVLPSEVVARGKAPHPTGKVGSPIARIQQVAHNCP
jgi:hypothetical protein